jgi:hypothetical protein
MAGLLDYFNQGSNALVGKTGNYGGLLGEDEQNSAQQAARMAMAAQLLDAGGWNEQRTGLGQALGRGMAAAGQARQGSVDQSLQAAMLRKQLASVQDGRTTFQKDYEYAKANGFKGSAEDWARVKAAQQGKPSSIVEHEYFQNLSPEMQKQFLSLQRSPVLPQVGQVNGVTSLIDRTATDPSKAVMALSSLPQEISARSQLAGAEAQAKATGNVLGEAEGSVQKKAINAQMIDDTLDIADPLIDLATGSGPGAASDKVAGFFGFAPDGAQATAQLQILQAGLMLNQPRMEGPQSDADVKLYQQAAGQLGDPTVPRDIKKAAVKTIRTLQDKYRNAASQSKERTNPGSTAKRPPLSSFAK